jgi:hypothetical protein
MLFDRVVKTRHQRVEESESHGPCMFLQLRSMKVLEWLNKPPRRVKSQLLFIWSVMDLDTCIRVWNPRLRCPHHVFPYHDMSLV